MVRTRAALLVAALAVLGLAAGGGAQLQSGFYKGKCSANDVEAIVQGMVRARFGRDAPIVAHLLRLQYHECGVNVCVTIIVLARAIDLLLHGRICTNIN